MENTPDTEIGKLEAGPSTPTDTATKEVRDDDTNLGDKINVTETKTSPDVAYRTTMKKHKDLSKLKFDYSRVQRVCRCFDEKDDLVKPIHYWFWPDELYQKDSDISSTSESETDEEKNERERRENDRYLTASDLERRIYHINRYLREKYNYCPWCGFQYDDEKDMEKTCPGPTREEHEGYSQTTFSDYDDDD